MISDVLSPMRATSSNGSIHHFHLDGVLAQQRTWRVWREQVAALLREQGDQMTACDLFAGRLSWNPLFAEETRDSLGTVQLRRKFPTDFYAEENAECKQYLPEVVSVDAQVLVDLTYAKRTVDMERLIEQCVVLGLPERYR